MQPSGELPKTPDDGSLSQQAGVGARRGLTPLHGNPASSTPTTLSPSINDLIEEYQRPGRTHFAEVKAAFEMDNGKIIENYFGRFVHAGTLLIEKSGSHWIGRFRRRQYRIALAYDSSKAIPALDEALRTVRIEERQSAVLLSGRAAQILTQTAYLLIVFLLSALDRPDPQSMDATATEHIATVVASARRDLRRMEQFTHASAKRSALQHYLMGLPLGAVAGILLVVSVFESQTVGRLASNSLLSSCLASGAIGAVISVMVRINRGTTLEVDFDRGRVVTLLAGSFRPVIGAVFGGALYVLVQAGLLPLQAPAPSGPDRTSFFFIGLAFLAGFSERWAQDTIVNSAPKFPATRSPEPLEDVEMQRSEYPDR